MKSSHSYYTVGNKSSIYKPWLAQNEEIKISIIRKWDFLLQIGCYSEMY